MIALNKGTEFSMGFSKFFATVFLALLVTVSVWANQQGRQVAAIKTPKGLLLVWNQPDNNFTLEITGQDVAPNNSTDDVFFKVDGIILQVQAAAVSEFVKDNDKAGQNAPAVLLAHRDWESQYVEGLFKKKINVQSSPLKLKGGSDALSWKFEMPEGFNDEAKKQLFLTVVNGKHVIVLNGVVTEKAKEDAVQQLLVKTLESLKVSSKPFNLQELQESIRRNASR
jgi:hypothetical protein